MAIFYSKLNSECNLTELKAKFFALLNEPNVENNILHEEQKLQIILAVRIKLQNELAKNSFLPRTKTDPATNKSMVVELLYWILMIVGLLQQGVGSYLFVTTLLSIMPVLPIVILQVISVLYIIFDAIIFYAFNSYFLRDALNLPRKLNNLGCLLKIYNEQLSTRIELNQGLAELLVLKMDMKQYENYVALVVLMNQDLRNKNKAMQDDSPSPFNELLKYGVIVFGLLSNIANSYYLGTAYAAVIAPIVGAYFSSFMSCLTIISGLSFYYAIGVTSIMRLSNPDQEDFDSLKIKLMEFSESYRNDLTDTLAFKSEINQNTQQIGVSSASRLRVFDKSVHKSTNTENYDGACLFDVMQY